VALKGNTETDYSLPFSHTSRNNMLRATLDLYASVIHFKNLPYVETRHKDVDIIVVQENTEGEYSNLEHESVKGVIESRKIITKAKSLRIAEHAFQLAYKMGRKKVTAVHKANIMKPGDGLFLRCCEEAASHCPHLALQSVVVDNATVQLVSRPQQFDVMVMPNLYGNIIGNICTGLEAASRQSGRILAHKNIANPTAMLLASCSMLDYLKLHAHALRIRAAILDSLKNKHIHTPDMGGQGTTLGFIQYVRDHIQDSS
jgi:isocitrate dehydrogenase (NAD+)